MIEADNADIKVVPVSRLARFVAAVLERRMELRSLAVRGEVTNCSPQPNGTMYFKLKDQLAVLNCVAWGDRAVTFPPFANGDEIVAYGSLSTYAKQSTYQLTVRAVDVGGAGGLHALYEERRKRLEAEGLFAPALKRALPAYPFRIALVSSRGAAGAGDFTSIVASRAPHVQIVWCETLVQGERAESDIARALARASSVDVDAVVLARGGGSFEELFAFSGEAVVRAVRRCRHPVISAVGHEWDTMLCDLAADRRASTPSNAAEIVTPTRVELLARVGSLQSSLQRYVDTAVDRRRRELGFFARRSVLIDPAAVLARPRQDADRLRQDLVRVANERMHRRHVAVRRLEKRLEPFDPSNQLVLRMRRLTEARFKLESRVRSTYELSLHARNARVERLAPAVENVLRRAAVGALGATVRLGPAFERRVAASSARIEPLERQLDRAAAWTMERQWERLRLISAKLNARDPGRVLHAGYAIVTYDGIMMRDARDVPVGARIEARLASGTLVARVEEHGNNGD